MALMNFASIMMQLTDIQTTLSFALAFKNEKHLENALQALNLCIDHLEALLNNQYKALQKKKDE